jgi:hypothetical protein
MSANDPTSRVARALREVDARQPKFVWPAPPYFEYDGEPRAQGEPCLLTFTDGDKAAGLLQNFLPEHEILKFQPEGGKNAQTIAFSSFVTLQLLDPVRLEVHTLPGASALHTPSERQPFSVTLTDSSLLEGETMGHVEALCGLFLFVPQPGNRGVLRWFVPAHAVRDRRLGRPLGEMLIEEQAASPETITQALERQKLLRARRFGEYLTANQIVSHEQLAAALKAQEAQPSRKLGETLVQLGYLTQAELAEALSLEARGRSVPLGRTTTRAPGSR